MCFQQLAVEKYVFLTAGCWNQVHTLTLLFNPSLIEDDALGTMDQLNEMMIVFYIKTKKG